jgi:hypothetical protein
VTPLELDVDLLPPVRNLILEADQSVVRSDDPEQDSGRENQEDEKSHGWLLNARLSDEDEWRGKSVMHSGVRGQEAGVRGVRVEV